MLVSYAPLRRWARAVGCEPGAYDKSGHIFGGQAVDVGAADGAHASVSALDGLFEERATAMVHVRAIEFGCFQTYVPRPGDSGIG